MSEVLFTHPKVGSLTIESGFNEISWSYDLNVARFQTYGGEVVQILSCFIDDMTIEGEVRSYKKAEQVYEWFAEYFVNATQTSNLSATSSSRFDQTPVTMYYHARGWEFALQPTDAPDFLYGDEMVTPKWSLKAHIVDRGINNAQLKAYVGQFAQEQLSKNKVGGDDFTLNGELSPVSGDPSKNPFIAPLVPKVSDTNEGPIEFKPVTAEEVMQDVHKYADFYTSLVPNFLEGDFADVASVTASGPVFATPGENPQEELEHNTANEEKITPGKTQKK